jgi:hypothetical protein
VGYTLFVDDNYHYMDESYRYRQGDYPTLEQALQAARDIVENWLLANYRPGMTAEALYEGYIQYGEDPFIVPPAGEEVAFSAWDYARQRCSELTE